MTFAELFKSTRVRHLKLRQTAMAKLLHVRQGTLSKIERGIMEPSASAFVCLWQAAAHKPKAKRALLQFLGGRDPK